MKPVISNKASIIIALLLLVSAKIVLLNQVLSSGTIGPQALSDELIYRLNSESIYNKTFYYNDHYPPFYPLLLSVAFFSKDNWYQWMFYINAVLTSLVLVPVWFISLRFLSRAASILVLLVSSLSTFHFFYPGLIMSENLHVPVFVFSVYLLFHTGSGPQSKKMTVSALLGITMALGYMTKYIYLVAIPVLVLLWFIKPMFHDDPEGRKLIKASRCFELLSMAAGFMSMFIPWYIYKYYSGFGIGGGLGAEFVLKGIPEFADLENLVRWTGFYLSYSLLSLFPFLLVLVLYLVLLSDKSVKNNRQETFFVLAVMLLSAVFFMTAVQHSWRAGYNYPLPYKIHGRYLMHLMPLWVVVFMMALDKVKNVVTGLKMTHIIYSCFLCFILLCVPYVLLVLSDYARSLVKSYPACPDALLYMTKPFFVLFAASIIIMGIILSLCSRNRLMASHYVILVSTLVISVQANSAIAAYKYMLSNRTEYQLHGRALSPFMTREVRENHENIVIVSDQRELIGKPGFRLGQSIQFWVTSSMGRPSIKFISFNDFLSHDGNWDGKLYGITTEPSDDPVYRYVVNGENYYVSDLAAWSGRTPGLSIKTGGKGHRPDTVADIRSPQDE